MANILDRNPGKWVDRLLIGTPMTGLVRSEWVMGRYGQVIPTNWSHVEIVQWMSSYVPLAYQIPDAENLIAKEMVERSFEWLLFIEHDNVLPPQTFIKINEYMIRGDVPIVGALYFTKSVPPEPMIYRDFGKGYYDDWKLGDKVWCRALPFGCTLIHGSIIKAMWNESPEYLIAGSKPARRIFKQPQDIFTTFDSADYLQNAGTSDIQFCKEIVERKIFKKAGWPKYQEMEYPFLVDTNIFVRHIDTEGNQYPLTMPQRYMPNGASPSNGKGRNKNRRRTR